MIWINFTRRIKIYLFNQKRAYFNSILINDMNYILVLVDELDGGWWMNDNLPVLTTEEKRHRGVEWVMTELWLFCLNVLLLVIHQSIWLLHKVLRSRSNGQIITKTSRLIDASEVWTLSEISWRWKQHSLFKMPVTLVYLKWEPLYSKLDLS